MERSKRFLPLIELLSAGRVKDHVDASATVGLQVEHVRFLVHLQAGALHLEVEHREQLYLLVVDVDHVDEADVGEDEEAANPLALEV